MRDAPIRQGITEHANEGNKSLMRKNNHGNRSENSPSTAEGHPNFQTEEFQLGYIYRGLKEDLNAFGSKTSGTISVADAAARLGNLLLAESSRALLDAEEHLPRLRGEATQRYEVGSPSSSLHVGTHAHQSSVKRPMSDTTKAKLRRIAKARWAKASGAGPRSYWSKLTPKQRSEEMKRRMAKRSQTETGAKSGDVICRLCSTPFPTRREYMLHFNQAHPDQVAKRLKRLKQKKLALARAA
jgi:uncharacterized C2H2 Zn-finger protein